MEKKLAASVSFRAVAYPVRVHAGLDALARLSDEVDRTGAKRGFVVCGPKQWPGVPASWPE